MISKPMQHSTRYLQILFLLLLVSFFGCRKSPPAETGFSSGARYNLAYGNGSLQRYDLFLPEGHDEHTKVIVLIHGGGWVSGDKAGCDYYAQRFCDSGLAAISMNYRLANDSVHYPEMLADIDSMIGCITKNASEWGIGNGRMALFGYSAGGHLALLYAYSADMKRKVSSVISLAGPTDIRDSLLWLSPGLYEEIQLMEGDTSPANWMQANPVYFAGDANPATLLIHGTNDEVVPVSQSLKLNQVLETSSTPVELMLLDKETHYFSAGATELFLKEAKRFLDTNMR